MTIYTCERNIVIKWRR